MDNPKKPKTGSQPMNLTKLQQQMMSSLPAGGRRNIKIVKTGQENKMKKVRPEVRQNLINKMNTKTPGGDVDPETGDLVDHTIHEYALTDKGRAALAADRVEKSGYIPPQSQVSDNMLNDILKKVSQNYKPKKKPGDPTNESVQKAGHPEAFELGLDKDTTDNKEYQKILRQKRIERALKMTDPTHPHHETDDVSQDDVEAADKAARGRKYTPRSVGRDGY
jgi:hypothetical protein